MKTIICVAALAMLAACQQSAPTPEETAAPVSGPVAADGKSSVGTYEITSPDGTKTMEMVRADGSYVSTVAGAVVSTGKWEQKSPTQYCVTEDEEGAEQVCLTEKIDDKGVWTATSPDGEIHTVVRISG